MLTLIKCVCLYFADYAVIYTGQRIIQRVRDRLFEHIIGQSMRFFAQHSTGKLISRVINDVDKIQETVSRSLADFARQLLTLIALIILVIYIDPVLSVATVLVGPVVGGLTTLLGKKVKRYGGQSQEYVAEMSNTLQEAISGSRVVQAFGMERFELDRFRQATGGVLRANLKAGRIISANPPVMEMIGVMIFIPFMVYAHFRIQSGHLTLATFATFLIALVRMYDPVRRISRMHLGFQQTFASVDRIFEVLDVDERVAVKPGAPDLPPIRETIRLEGVGFHYEKKGGHPLHVLQDVDLAVRRGEILAIVGSSGAGKTTLVNLLPRFSTHRGRGPDRRARMSAT